tara:strand:- start:2369 stop:2785 length:417 start_codon:yes stop_codon:yes gene_type:complete
MWFDILKNDKVDELRQQFSNKQKAIGYIPIEWGDGSEEEIKALASELGLEYKEYPQQRKIENPNPTGHSFANGGHFMWDAGKIEPHLEKTEFDTVQSLIDFIAVNSYREKPYRRVIDYLFGDENVVLVADRRDKGKYL